MDKSPAPEPPLLSVVIPAYNRATTVTAAIDSVLTQTRGDFELIVVDDGSSDGTPEVVAKIADPRLRLIANPRNMGAAGARNAGVAAARGTWIAFQDSDDEWLPKKLELQMQRLLAPGAAYVGAYCGLLIVGAFREKAGPRTKVRYVPEPRLLAVEGDILPLLLKGNLISTQTLVVRRDLFLALGSFDEATTPIEDWDFALRLAQAGPIAFVDEPLVHQHFSDNSITRLASRRLRSIERVVEKNRALYARHPDLLALQYYIIAGGNRRQGDLARAQHYLGLARAAQPGNLRLWAMSGYVALQRLLAPLGVRLR